MMPSNSKIQYHIDTLSDINRKLNYETSSIPENILQDVLVGAISRSWHGDSERQQLLLQLLDETQQKISEAITLLQHYQQNR